VPVHWTIHTPTATAGGTATASSKGRGVGPHCYRHRLGESVEGSGRAARLGLADYAAGASRHLRSYSAGER
jgi:hypothetical protein